MISELKLLYLTMILRKIVNATLREFLFHLSKTLTALLRKIPISDASLKELKILHLISTLTTLLRKI